MFFVLWFSGGLLSCLMYSDMYIYRYLTQYKTNCLFINLKDSQMKLYSLTLKSFGTRQLFYRLSCKYPVLHTKHICGMQCSCKLQKNCNLGFCFFFLFLFGFTGHRKGLKEKRSMQCGVQSISCFACCCVLFFLRFRHFKVLQDQKRKQLCVGC